MFELMGLTTDTLPLFNERFQSASGKFSKQVLYGATAFTNFKNRKPTDSGHAHSSKVVILAKNKKSTFKLTIRGV